MKNLIPFSIISSALIITLVLLLLYLRGMGLRKNKNTHVTTMAAALLTQQDAILNYLSWLWKVKKKQNYLKLYLWCILRAYRKDFKSVLTQFANQGLWALEPLKHRFKKKTWPFLPCFPSLHPGPSQQCEMLTSTTFIKNNKTHVIHLIKEEKIKWNYMKKHYVAKMVHTYIGITHQIAMQKKT